MERLGGVLERLGGVLEASWSVLERLGALLQAIWPDAENVEKPLVFLAFWSLGRSWRPLEASWSRLGDVLEPSWSDLKLLLSALGASKCS